jgi:hypothetical protein
LFSGRWLATAGVLRKHRKPVKAVKDVVVWTNPRDMEIEEIQ